MDVSLKRKEAFEIARNDDGTPRVGGSLYASCDLVVPGTRKSSRAFYRILLINLSMWKAEGNNDISYPEFTDENQQLFWKLAEAAAKDYLSENDLTSGQDFYFEFENGEFNLLTHPNVSRDEKPMSWWDFELR